MTPRVLMILLTTEALVACSSNESGSGGGDPRTIVVRMSDDLRFDPATIDVEPGETVQFELINEGEAVHEFLLGDEAAQAEFEEEIARGEMHHVTDAGVAVDPGETESFEYTFPDTAGDFSRVATSQATTTAAWSQASASAIRAGAVTQGATLSGVTRTPRPTSPRPTA